MRTVKMMFIMKVILLVALVLSAVGMPAALLAQESEFQLPAPTGPYQVGRISRHWVDAIREEINTEDTDDFRELLIDIWYPAEVEADATPAPYFEDLSGPMGEEALAAWTLGDEIGLDSSSPATQELLQWTTHTYADAALSD
ncbi:hypothetical protein ACFLYO_10020, partial [Chloroflexota bacterium]